MRKLCVFAGGFSAAVFAVIYGVEPFLLLLPLLGLLKREDRRLRLALLCAGLALGLAWPGGYTAIIEAPWRDMVGGVARLSATVVDEPWETVLGGAATVRVAPEGGQAFRAVLYAGPEAMELLPGDQVSFTAECERANDISDRAEGIFLLCYAQGELDAFRPERVPPSCYPAVWARALKDAVRGAFPADTAGLIQALITGDKSGLSDAQYASLKRTGLAHAVAVSGMHVAFLTGIAVQLFGARKRRTAAIAIPVLIVFALAAGATPSVVRAVIMQVLLLLAPLLGRESDPPTSLSAALLLLLLQNPYAAAGVGLQFSFAAVAGILAFSGRMNAWVLERLGHGGAKGIPARAGRAAARFAAAGICTTLGAAAFTTPLAAYYFDSVSLVAPLANLLCLWAVSLCFSVGLLSAVLALVSPALGAAAAHLATPAARYFLWMTDKLAGVPFAAVTASGVYYRAWLLLAYGVVLLFLVMKGRRPVVPVCACVSALGLAMLLTRLSVTLGPLTVTVLNVGQGQSVVLRAGERTALVDCGGNGRNAGDLAADYLGDFGRNRVDLLVLTHFHADHANGVLELLERVDVDVLAVPDREQEDPLGAEILALAREKGTQVVCVDDDLPLKLGPALLTLYAPLGAGEANEAGLSVLCETEGFSALFTGDMDETVEARLVKYGSLPDVDLFIAGHHGSATSSSALLLEAVRPEVAVVSSGENTYGHPKPETLLRLRDAGADIYRTDLQGNVTITVR